MLGDPVPFRVHWPRMADLRVNAMQYRPYGRSAATKLGVNARDEPASVGMMCSQVRITTGAGRLANMINSLNGLQRRARLKSAMKTSIVRCEGVIQADRGAWRRGATG